MGVVFFLPEDRTRARLTRPEFATVEEYAGCFTDAGYWRPYVEVVCVRHRLGPCRRVRPGLPGTHPVFIVDGRYAVKFYTRLFGGAASFPIELDVYGLIARTPGLPAPALMASGALFTGDDGWTWPYIVTRIIRGTSIGEVEDRVAYPDKVAMSAFLGRVVRRIHSLPLASARRLRPSWENFDLFLAERRAGCVEHARRQGMPELLVAQIDGYLPALSGLIDRTSAPHLLHCDLNADHILGYFDGGRWRPTGIIDFGDAKVGDRLYELVAIHIGLFRCDKRLLRVFLRSYGFDEALRRDFVARAMSLTLLHEFDVLAEVFGMFHAASEIKDLDELAELMWHPALPGLPANDAVLSCLPSGPCNNAALDPSTHTALPWRGCRGPGPASRPS
jgi:hygromycin-B 7''-O-kinase